SCRACTLLLPGQLLLKKFRPGSPNLTTPMTLLPTMRHQLPVVHVFQILRDNTPAYVLFREEDEEKIFCSCVLPYFLYTSVCLPPGFSIQPALLSIFSFQDFPVR